MKQPCHPPSTFFFLNRTDLSAHLAEKLLDKLGNDSNDPVHLLVNCQPDLQGTQTAQRSLCASTCNTFRGEQVSYIIAKLPYPRWRSGQTALAEALDGGPPTNRVRRVLLSVRDVC